MGEPSVLLCELDRERRRSLSFGLTAEGYEVVPVTSLEETVRFADALGTVVIVAPLALVRDRPEGLDGLARGDDSRTLVLLGERPEEADAAGDDALYLPTEGLSDAEIIRRVKLTLTGKEVGVEADYRLRGLIGDFSLVSPLELVRRLGNLGVSARIELGDGELFMRQGELVHARVGGVGGVKGFCRLGRRADGPFRVFLTSESFPPREIEESLDFLITAAISDSVGQAPDPHLRYRVEMSREFFAAPFNSLQQEIISRAFDGCRLSSLLDTLPLPDGEIMSEVARLERRGVLARLEPEPRVAIVTDSTADLPSDVLQRHRIDVVPLNVHFGDEVLIDRTELEPALFYEMLETRSEHPSTSPPSVERLALEFQRRLRRQDIVALHISEKLSQTVVHSRRAAEDGALGELLAERRDGATLEVIDTGQVSLPLGLLAMFASRLAGRGMAADEITRRVLSMSERQKTLFLVDTLDYLQRGGRIGRARALIGKVMGIKPILGVEEGEVVSVGRVRGQRASLPRVFELALQAIDPDRPTVVGVAHAKAPAKADRLRELIEERLPVLEIFVAEMGPVVGAHVGPGCVGATFFQPTDEEQTLLALPDAAERGSAVSGAPA